MLNINTRLTFSRHIGKLFYTCDSLFNKMDLRTFQDKAIAPEVSRALPSM